MKSTSKYFVLVLLIAAFSCCAADIELKTSAKFFYPYIQVNRDVSMERSRLAVQHRGIAFGVPQRRAAILQQFKRSHPYRPVPNPTKDQRDFVRGIGRYAIKDRKYTVAGGRVTIAQKTKGRTPYTTWVCAKLSKSYLGRGSETNPFTQAHKNFLGKSSDQAGHILAHMLGFTGTEAWNIVPLNKQLNYGPMKSVEYQIRCKVTNVFLGDGLKMYVRMKYSGTSSRPYELWVFLEGGMFEELWILKNN